MMNIEAGEAELIDRSCGDLQIIVKILNLSLKAIKRPLKNLKPGLTGSNSHFF